MYKLIGSDLKLLRRATGISAKDFAFSLGHPGTSLIRKYEKGQQVISSLTSFRLIRIIETYFHKLKKLDKKMHKKIQL